MMVSIFPYIKADKVNPQKSSSGVEDLYFLPLVNRATLPTKLLALIRFY
jgi:hypothetical protein